MRVAVLGTGYVGLVTAACLAELGNEVIAVDIDPERIERLRRGEMPLHEPELAPLVTMHQATSRLGFTVDLALALRRTDLVIVAVGTPPGVRGEADLKAVLQAAHAVGQTIEQPATLVIKSTVPVGTTDRVTTIVRRQLRLRGCRFAVPVVSNPEFLREGSAVHDFLKPDRIVIGARSRGEAQLMHVLYAPLLAREVPLLLMDTRSAELTKYAANVMLAARISLMNEFAALAESLDADIEHVRLGIGSDHRLGRHFLRAGAGYGGSCFPKDVKALAQLAESHGVVPRMLRAIDRVNEQQKRLLFRKIAAFYGGPHRLAGKHLAVWGLAFKPGTDDLREAPSIVLVHQLLEAGATVCAYDPAAGAKSEGALGHPRGFRTASKAVAALHGADALVLMTEWPEFAEIGPATVAACLGDAAVFDGRNALDVARWRRHGLRVLQVGRPSGGVSKAGRGEDLRNDLRAA
jgi:UDPglucose 6-dehydrogenase